MFIQEIKNLFFRRFLFLLILPAEILAIMVFGLGNFAMDILYETITSFQRYW